jgi:hypothetical protein
MTKTWSFALACAISVASLAQAQTSGSAGGGASVGAGAGASSGGVSGGATGGAIGGGSLVTPPASTGVGVSGSAGGAAPTAQPSQPSIDINQAQQPGVGVNSGASNNGSIRPLSR